MAQTETESSKAPFATAPGYYISGLNFRRDRRRADGSIQGLTVGDDGGSWVFVTKASSIKMEAGRRFPQQQHRRSILKNGLSKSRNRRIWAQY